MDCTDIKVIVSGLIDDELDGETRHRAERHLSECAKCRELVDETETLNELIATSVEQGGTGELPAGFVDAVLGRTVRAETTSRLGWTSWLGWLAAAAALVLAVSIWIMDHQRRQGAGSALPDETVATSGVPGVRTASSVLRSRTYAGLVPPDLIDARAVDGAIDEGDRDLGPGDSSLAATSLVAEPGTSAPPSSIADVEAMPDGSHLPPAILREDAELLDSAALLLDMLAAADDESFADVERIRKITEYDEVLTRLASTRHRLEPAAHPAVFAAESVLLRIVHGPMSQGDLQELRESVQRSDLSSQLLTISNRWDPDAAL